MPQRYAVSSVHRQQGKPNLFCAFYDPEGFRRFRSTGTENLRVAKTICSVIERASLLARQGKLSEPKALKLIRESRAAIEETHGKLVADAAERAITSTVQEFVAIAGGQLSTYSIKQWLTTYLAGRTDASKGTLIEYQRIVDRFIERLGTKADRPLTTLQPVDVENFKAWLIGKVAPTTVNKSIKVLKAAFTAAVAKRQLEFSPAQHIEPIAEDESNRRPFSAAELRKLMAKADGEWRTMVLLGYYIGQRLRDCANMTWRRVDLLEGTINLSTKKTKRRQDIPIAEPLLKHLSTLAGDDPDAPLCPSLHNQPASKLSAAFYRLMVDAGLVEKRDHQSKGKGRDGKRERTGISFHSLRYNTTSALKSSGTSNAVAMDIVGHDTEAVSQSYTVIELEAKRTAINRLPDITR